MYTFAQWVFFFYFYCFIGWIWETCYVSVLKGKWVNRGFMRGPFLPIYGSGALIVLIFTLPFRTQPVPVFFMGMISATILEYVTGVVMEKLFHVRYWDYSNQKLNINGHICLSSSLAWGVFALILTMHAHSPIEHMVLSMSGNLVEVLVFLLTVYISIDMAESVREALNLKELLVSLEENNAEFRRLQKHLEVLSAFYGSELKGRSEEGLRRLNALVESGKEIYVKGSNLRNKKVVNKEVFEKNVEKNHTRKLETFKKVSDILEAYAERMKTSSDKDETILKEINDARAGISRQLRNILPMKNREYLRLRDLLKRNPAAVSRMHEEAFSEILEMASHVDTEEIDSEETGEKDCVKAKTGE